MKNGIYFVWTKVKGCQTGWFLCSVNNGHVTALGFDDKLPSAARLVSDDVPFLRLPQRLLDKLPKDATPEDMLVMLEEPEYTPWHCMVYERRASI